MSAHFENIYVPETHTIIQVIVGEMHLLLVVPYLFSGKVFWVATVLTVT